MTKRPRTTLSWRKKVLFAAIVLTAVLGSLEVVARIIGAPDMPDSPYIDSSREMEWELRPNSETVWGKKHILVKTNSLGFRDSELKPEVATNEYRILFLGDSVVFGFELDERDSIPTRLESALGERDPSRQYEVINAGLEGYNQLSSYYNLQHKGWQTKPRFILLGFVINDVYEPYNNMKRFGARAQFMYGKKSLLRSAKYVLRLSAAFRLLENQYLVRFVLPTVNRAPYDFDHMYKAKEPPEISTAWEECLAELKLTKESADEHDIPLMVVYFSTKWRFNKEATETQRPARILEQFAEENRIAVFDYFPEMAECADPESLFQDGDSIHYNGEGNRLIAEWIADVFDKADLLHRKPGEVFDALAPWRDAAAEAIAERETATHQQ